MAASVVYAGVFAAVLASIPSVRTRMVVFDTAVVDLTEELIDPVAITQGFRFLSATNSLSSRFYRAGKGTLGIDPPPLVAVPIPGKY